MIVIRIKTTLGVHLPIRDWRCSSRLSEMQRALTDACYAPVDIKTPK